MVYSGLCFGAPLFFGADGKTGSIVANFYPLPEYY